MPDDAFTVYSHGPTSDETLYVHVDEKFRYCYRAKHGIEIPSVFVLPVNRYLLRRPQTLALWDKMIVYLLS